jgi:hypothetical protein
MGNSSGRFQGKPKPQIEHSRRHDRNAPLSRSRRKINAILISAAIPPQIADRVCRTGPRHFRNVGARVPAEKSRSIGRAPGETGKVQSRDSASAGSASFYAFARFKEIYPL